MSLWLKPSHNLDGQHVLRVHVPFFSSTINIIPTSSSTSSFASKTDLHPLTQRSKSTLFQ
ncbi:hypothetical protein RchiOBHm_Chr1g0361481 [Rosa chinensis]|uniref:Uncharacterized protein n=1 Tax=Rosa chinensis TaxID=74649 RepID=A0A2P6SIZ4_ROSCH|nr:hypothetical protein RchiOBHm_Chr1g0361481 [Rosa chinensis]